MLAANVACIIAPALQGGRSVVFYFRGKLRASGSWAEILPGLRSFASDLEDLDVEEAGRVLSLADNLQRGRAKVLLDVSAVFID